MPGELSSVAQRGQLAGNECPEGKDRLRLASRCAAKAHSNENSAGLELAFVKACRWSKPVARKILGNVVFAGFQAGVDKSRAEQHNLQKFLQNEKNILAKGF